MAAATVEVEDELLITDHQTALEPTCGLEDKVGAGLKSHQHRVARLLRRLGIEDFRGGQMTTGPQGKIKPTG